MSLEALVRNFHLSFQPLCQYSGQVQGPLKTSGHQLLIMRCPPGLTYFLPSYPAIPLFPKKNIHTSGTLLKLYPSSTKAHFDFLGRSWFRLSWLCTIDKKTREKKKLKPPEGAPQHHIWESWLQAVCRLSAARTSYSHYSEPHSDL